MRRLGIFIVLVMVLIGLVPHWAHGQGVAQCGGGSADGSSPQAKLSLERVNGEAIAGPVSTAFGDRRSRKTFLFEYKVDGCSFSAKELNSDVDLEYFEPRDKNGEQLASEIAIGGRIKAPQIVVVTLELDPADDGASPGSFRTGFAVTDSRFDLFRQDVTATLRYEPSALLMLTILLPVVVVGSLLVWAKGRAGGSRESFFQWVRKLVNIFSIGAGIAAVLWYFNTVVFSDEDFGRQLFENPVWQWPWQGEWLKAVGGSGSAFVTAVLGFSLIGDKARGGTDQLGSPGEPGRFR